LENDFAKGTDSYPKSIEAAVALMNRYKSNKTFYIKPKGDTRNDKDGAFAQEVGSSTGKKSVKCWHCNGDHYKSECPKLAELEEGVDQLNIKESDDDSNGLSFFQKDDGNTQLNSHYLYLDTCTNFHSACSDEHLTNLRRVKGGGLVSRCNAGTTQTKMKGNFGNLELWYNPSGIANLLSFDKMEKDGYEFTYQTKRTGGRYVCHTPNGDVKFEKCNKLGFHYVDMRSNEAEVCLLNTVRGNYEGYTKHRWKMLGKLAGRSVWSGIPPRGNSRQWIKGEDNAIQTGAGVD